MTRSGERSALDPDLVPVHQRVRDLCDRFPEGPLPATEVEELRKSIMKPRPGTERLMPVRRTDPPESIEHHRQRRRAAHSKLAGRLRAARSASPADLATLSTWLRRHHGYQRTEFDTEALGLQPGKLRAIARHLLRGGVSGVEVLIGLQLMEGVAEPDDADLILTLGLIGRDCSRSAVKALQPMERAASHLFAFARRVTRVERWQAASALAACSRGAIDELLAVLPMADRIALLRMVADRQGMPEWLPGNRLLAEAVEAAAEDPASIDDGQRPLESAVWLRNEIRFGKSAFVGYSPGGRQRAISGLGSWLASPRAPQSLGPEVKQRPSDSHTLWLHRHVIEARRDPEGAVPAGLEIAIAVPPPESGADGQTHLLIDGEPLVPRVFPWGDPLSPESLLDREGRLRADIEPREVVLAEASCAGPCCGTLRASIWRDEATGRVEWETWGTLRGEGHRERFSFDADAYDAEIDRASGDFTWEWPARRAARLLRERLRSEPALLSRWNCRLAWVYSWNRDRSTLRLVFDHPDAPYSQDQPWIQFMYEAEIRDAAVVDDKAVNALVDRVVTEFRETDPKTLARICGGSKEHAEALGFSLPDD